MLLIKHVQHAAQFGLIPHFPLYRGNRSKFATLFRRDP